MKPGLSKVNARRNYSLRAAEEKIKADGKASNAKVEVKMKDRKVLVNGEEAFVQSKDELGGCFVGAFAHLALD